MLKQSRLLLVCGLVAVLTGCMSEQDQQKVAAEALWDAGYTKVTLGRSTSYNCSEDDTYGREFQAVGPTGRKDVHGVVCFDSVKGTTIRLFRR